jgi:hypothetical protein
VDQAVTAAPSLLVCLFADRLFAVDSAEYEKRVATLLVASALWSLQEQGLIAIEAVTSRILFWRSDEVVVYDRSRVTDVEREDDFFANYGRRKRYSTLQGHYSLEQQFLDRVCEVLNVSVTGLLAWLIESRVTNPWAKVISIVKATAKHLGYLKEVPVQRTLVEHLTKPAVQIIPDSERLAALEPSFMAFVAQWDTFKTTQPTLHARLKASCSQGIFLRAARAN